MAPLLKTSPGSACETNKYLGTALHYAAQRGHAGLQAQHKEAAEEAQSEAAGTWKRKLELWFGFWCNTRITPKNQRSISCSASSHNAPSRLTNLTSNPKHCTQMIQSEDMRTCQQARHMGCSASVYVPMLSGIACYLTLGNCITA